MNQSADFDHAAFKAFEREGYSRVAKDYAERAASITARLNAPMLEALGAGPGVRWLDVACGPGMLTGAAAGLGCAVTGLDYAEPMVCQARESFPTLSFQVGDGEALPFADQQFDAVSCSFGILHFSHPEQAIAEANRVLVPGGRYAFTCWTPPPRNTFMTLILDAVQKHGALDLPLPPGPPMFRFGDPAECERAVRAAGMQFIECREVWIDWEFDSVEQIVTTVASSTARMGALLNLQTPERLQLIEQAIVEGASAYARDGRIAFPVPVNLTIACRPADQTAEVDA
jgi:SAM-dependent methyltransferase